MGDGVKHRAEMPAGNGETAEHHGKQHDKPDCRKHIPATPIRSRVFPPDLFNDPIRKNFSRRQVNASPSKILEKRQFLDLREALLRCLKQGPRALQLRVRARHVERSEEHTSELQSLMRTSYAVLCLKKKKQSQK